MFENDELIDDTLSAKLRDRMPKIRKKYFSIMYKRYLELLPIVITYTGLEGTAIDPLLLESGLRHGYRMVVGTDANGIIKVLGYVNNTQDYADPKFMFSKRVFEKDDINFIVEPDEIPQNDMKQITMKDGGATGEFVIIRNKPLTYGSDFEWIRFHLQELAEVQLSRYSLIMQSKANTFFTNTVEGDETINVLVENLMNGVPVSTVTAFFDPQENMHTFDNTNLANSLAEVKREHSNIMAECNAGLGFSTLGVDKESGVSDAEANSNKGYSTAMGNIFLKGRQSGFELLNRRFQKNIQASYDDEVVSELTSRSEVTDFESHN